MRRYWINTVSKDHVRIGVEGGFTQANHGRQTGLRRLSCGDLVVFYSPRASYADGEPLQCFTAIGRIDYDAPYQAVMSPDFHPWRRRMRFLDCREAPIRELIGELTFIKDKARWGMPFRRGLFEIDAQDFERIAGAMGVRVELTQG
jgi:hypothetical protein